MDATLLDVTFCVRLLTLLHVVGSCCAKFETGQTLSYLQTNASIPNNVGELLANNFASVCSPCCMLLRCWELSRKRFETGQTLSCVQTDATISNNVASVCSPCCMLLGVVAQTLWNRSNLICVQTDATIPNNVGELLANNCASVCSPCWMLLHCLELLRKVWNRSNFKLRSNRRKYSQQCCFRLLTLLYVVVLLGVVAQSLKPIKL